MTEMTKKPNWFVRLLIIFFCIGLSIMIYYNFFYVEPVGIVKNGLYTLLALLLILVLSESFDNFSIGKLISITRDVKEKNEENKKLEQKNSELISQIISISNIQNQKQESTNVFGDYYTLNKKNIQVGNENSDSVQELIDRIGHSVVIADVETNIKSELQEKGLNIEGDTNKVLIRHLAGTQLLLEFERIHSNIFGSQIHFLRQLNVSISKGLTNIEVTAHFEKVKQTYNVFNEWNSEQYFNYLFSKLLITKNDNNSVHITNMGVEYLTWITRNGINDNKSL